MRRMKAHQDMKTRLQTNSTAMRPYRARSPHDPPVGCLRPNTNAASLRKPAHASMASSGPQDSVTSRVSNDNPYREAQFKTIKYRPSFSRRFGCIQEARGTLNPFFAWYTAEYRHSGIAYLTPDAVHPRSSKPSARDVAQSIRDPSRLFCPRSSAAAKLILGSLDQSA